MALARSHEMMRSVCKFPHQRLAHTQPCVLVEIRFVCDIARNCLDANLRRAVCRTVEVVAQFEFRVNGDEMTQLDVDDAIL